MFGLTILTHSGRLLTHEQATTGIVAVGLIALLTGVLLVIGFLTTLEALLAGALCVYGLPTIMPGAYLFASGVTSLFAGAVAFSIALLGPGAFSADARLFGPREIVIPTAISFRDGGTDHLD